VWGGGGELRRYTGQKPTFTMHTRSRSGPKDLKGSKKKGTSAKSGINGFNLLIRTGALSIVRAVPTARRKGRKKFGGGKTEKSN